MQCPTVRDVMLRYVTLCDVTLHDRCAIIIQNSSLRSASPAETVQCLKFKFNRQRRRINIKFQFIYIHWYFFTCIEYIGTSKLILKKEKEEKRRKKKKEIVIKSTGRKKRARDRGSGECETGRGCKIFIFITYVPVRIHQFRNYFYNSKDQESEERETWEATKVLIL